MVSREEVSEMERLNRIMKGERPAPTATTMTTSAGGPNPDAIILQKGPSSADVSDMAKIMENFSGATGVTSFKSLHDNATTAVNELVNTAHVAPVLNEALRTTQTDTGVKIGVWEITKHQREGMAIKPDIIYKVNNTNTGQKIKASFMVLESARSVVKLLNNGADFSHPVIKQIAQFEIDYRTTRTRALEEKACWQRAKKKNSEFKMNLYEAKFDAAKNKTLLIRERIINVFNKI